MASTKNISTTADVPYRIILGIETSCDETSVSVVRDGHEILSNVISTSIDLHRITGGVVPEVAAREQIRYMIPVLDEALSKAGVDQDDIDAIAVAYGPGLIGSLLVGVETARALAFAWGKPIIPINHIAGHIYGNFLERSEEFRFPIMILTASGGHNELILMSKHGDFQLLGETIDDAAGEAFDKVARMIGLPYPGGPEISRVAESGDHRAYCLPKSWLERPQKDQFCGSNFDFSFSGLKSAVRRVREQLGERLSDQEVADIAASFEHAVVEVLSQKTVVAAQKHGAREIHLAGGVSANRALRKRVAELAGDITFRFPVQMSYCTDNAAMIAAAGYWQSEKAVDWRELRVDAQDFEV